MLYSVQHLIALVKNQHKIVFQLYKNFVANQVVCSAEVLRLFRDKIDSTSAVRLYKQELAIGANIPGLECLANTIHLCEKQKDFLFKQVALLRFVFQTF